MRRLTVRLRHSPEDSVVVGTLAEHQRRIYFEFDAAFLASGLNLSPFKLPLRSGLIEHTDLAFGPLPGLFDDSLPDGWGLLLMDRRFRGKGIDSATLSPLDRLAYLGTRTMGALTYHPPHEVDRDGGLLDLHELGTNAEDVLAGDAVVVLPQLMQAGGSPGGARPKVLIGIHDDRIVSGEDDLPDGLVHWIVKFAAREEARDAGPVEYAYSLMARAAGLELPEARLFELGRGRRSRRYFAVARFDRGTGNRRVHVHTFGNLIHANFRIPSTDYADLFKVTRALTRNHDQIRKLFRRMVFNVAAHNRDDHSKNFAFMLDHSTGEWSLTPAYDLTYSPGPGGEHTTSLLGEGKCPTREHCLELAGQVGLRRHETTPIIDQVNASIARWRDFAGQAGCTRQITSTIGAALRAL